ncbi:hypothetical protein CYR55_22930 [Chimaeribacter californicus]|uniref:Uncharacterized protein n=1 Tax=Chimaeribacter californicus TaxID=2060067 RepID=A0A2N5DSR7_9GAMM|nr:hypothetical protein [Chimaeribacter californicus]PLR29202.1 hypothetical protein CYR55_22930 [Chimaeribacter californicus]
MKVSDDSLMQAIFSATLEDMPARAVIPCIGGAYSLDCDTPLNLRRSVMQLANRRHHLNSSLGESQSLARIRALVDMDALHSDEDRARREPGRTFYYWIPVETMRPVWERCRQLLSDCGITETAIRPYPSNFATLASSVSHQLVEEFSLQHRRHIGRSKWAVQNDANDLHAVPGDAATHLHRHLSDGAPAPQLYRGLLRGAEAPGAFLPK